MPRGFSSSDARRSAGNGLAVKELADECINELFNEEFDELLDELLDESNVDAVNCSFANGLSKTNLSTEDLSKTKSLRGMFSPCAAMVQRSSYTSPSAVIAPFAV